MKALDAATVAIVLAIACPVLIICALAFLLVCGVSGKRVEPFGGDPKPVPLMQPDPTPFEDEPTGEIPVVDPQAVEKYPLVPGGWVEFRGGLVHIRCLDPLLRNDARPCAGCAVHLDHVLTGAS